MVDSYRSSLVSCASIWVCDLILWIDFVAPDLILEVTHEIAGPIDVPIAQNAAASQLNTLRH